MGQTVTFVRTDGTEVPAKIVSTVFHDPEGEKQNA